MAKRLNGSLAAELVLNLVGSVAPHAVEWIALLVEHEPSRLGVDLVDVPAVLGDSLAVEVLSAAVELGHSWAIQAYHFNNELCFDLDSINKTIHL